MKFRNKILALSIFPIIGTVYVFEGEEAPKTKEIYAPLVSTIIVANTTVNSATITASAMSSEETPVVIQGVCYATTPNPTIANGVIQQDEKQELLFDAVLLNLAPNTTYYARAYAINKAGVSYGEELSFKTNGRELSLK